MDEIGNHVDKLREKLMEKLVAGKIKLPGRVSFVNIRHDEWCDQLRGRGVCNCDPDFDDPVLVEEER